MSSTVAMDQAEKIYQAVNRETDGSADFFAGLYDESVELLDELMDEDNLSAK